MLFRLIINGNIHHTVGKNWARRPAGAAWLAGPPAAARGRPRSALDPVGHDERFPGQGARDFAPIVRDKFFGPLPDLRERRRRQYRQGRATQAATRVTLLCSSLLWRNEIAVVPVEEFAVGRRSSPHEKFLQALWDRRLGHPRKRPKTRNQSIDFVFA